MADINELTGILERAKTDGAAPITISGDKLMSLIQFVRLIPGAVEVPAFMVPAESPPSFPAAIEDAYVSIEEVCRELDISHMTLFRMRNEGKFIPEKKVGGRKVRFLRSDLEQWKRTNWDYIPLGFQAASR